MRTDVAPEARSSLTTELMVRPVSMMSLNNTQTHQAGASENHLSQRARLHSWVQGYGCRRPKACDSLADEHVSILHKAEVKSLVELDVCRRLVAHPVRLSLKELHVHSRGHRLTASCEQGNGTWIRNAHGSSGVVWCTGVRAQTASTLTYMCLMRSAVNMKPPLSTPSTRRDLLACE